jgi:TonB family protein
MDFPMEQESLRYDTPPLLRVSKPGFRFVDRETPLLTHEFRMRARLSPDGKGFQVRSWVPNRMWSIFDDLNRTLVYRPALLHKDPVSCWVDVAITDPLEVRVVSSDEEYVYYDADPVPIRKVEPEYTKAARRAKLTGDVVLHVRIDPDGRPGKINVFRSIPGLDEAAVDAMKAWLFRPAMRGTTAVVTWKEFRIHFPPDPSSRR